MTAADTCPHEAYIAAVAHTLGPHATVDYLGHDHPANGPITLDAQISLGPPGTGARVLTWDLDHGWEHGHDAGLSGLAIVGPLPIRTVAPPAQVRAALAALTTSPPPTPTPQPSPQATADVLAALAAYQPQSTPTEPPPAHAGEQLHAQQLSLI